MKTVVVGAGAMGTFITARLFMAGHEVWLLEVNDKRVTKIKEKGLCLEENDDSNNLKFPTITSNPSVSNRFTEAGVAATLCSCFRLSAGIPIRIST